jgi:isopentenyl-diphosphate Delta-isomerase
MVGVSNNGAPHPELVVLVDEQGRNIGTAPKSEVHHNSTPLHLAFSCYLFDPAGNVLMTRRALDKRAFPGVWTNSFCGHPGPGEDLDSAVQRRALTELGVPVTGLRCVLPDFRYHAVDAAGVAENELCPVYRAVVAGPVVADPAEVMDWVWVSWAQLRDAARSPWLISPWMAEQVPLLEGAGAHVS